MLFQFPHFRQYALAKALRTRHLLDGSVGEGERAFGEGICHVPVPAIVHERLASEKLAVTVCAVASRLTRSLVMIFFRVNCGDAEGKLHHASQTHLSVSCSASRTARRAA